MKVITNDNANLPAMDFKHRILGPVPIINQLQRPEAGRMCFPIFTYYLALLVNHHCRIEIYTRLFLLIDCGDDVNAVLFRLFLYACDSETIIFLSPLHVLVVTVLCEVQVVEEFG